VKPLLIIEYSWIHTLFLLNKIISGYNLISVNGIFIEREILYGKITEIGLKILTSYTLPIIKSKFTHVETKIDDKCFQSILIGSMLSNKHFILLHFIIFLVTLIGNLRTKSKTNNVVVVVNW